MERNLERQTLSFSKGMTNVPSDLLSDDSELLESDGFIFKDGEMKAVQRPVSIGNIDFTLMYIHKMADFKCLIAKIEHSQSIACYRMNGGQIDMDSMQSFSIGEPLDIKSVGNTLVCTTENGIHYLSFKGGKYKDLGTDLPTPVVSFIFNEVENPFQVFWQNTRQLMLDSIIMNVEN